MGCIYYEKNEFNYNDSEHKTLLEIFEDNGLSIEGLARVHIVIGNSLENGSVKSVSDKDVFTAKFIPIGDVTCSNDIKNENDDILSLLYNSLKEDNKSLGVAVDIGTSSIVCYICNLTTKEILTIKLAKNPLSYFATMTDEEISAHLSEKDKTEVQAVLVNAINSVIMSGCREYGLSQDDITTILVSGNTLMEHLISAVDTAPMFGEKHIPESLFGVEELSVSFGLVSGMAGKCYVSPCGSNNIGGDTVAGMIYCNIDKNDKNILYLDIGTDTAIVLKSRGNYSAVSVSTPAFDGEGISCGMIPESGAVHDASVKNGEMKYSTIHEVVPEGVCGIGLVNIVAESMKSGKITKNGEIIDGCVVINESVSVTQTDVDELMKQKSLIYSGIAEVLDKSGTGMDEVDEIILSGGFAVKFNANNICKIGAIPTILQDRIRSVVGNASGLGSVKVLVGGMGEFDRMIELSEKFM